MCGILVAYAKKGTLDENSCSEASKKIFSRGPDYNFSRFKLNGRLFLSQTVLSITGNPRNNLNYTTSQNRRYEILFNGEIYNFKDLQNKFLRDNPNISNTDTETLVNLHEKNEPDKVFENLKGMFAYVLYDSQKNTLTIARDILGEKVLYQYEDESIFIISSQIGPILELSKNISINKDALREYFFTRHLITRRNTIYNNLNTYLPGSLKTIDLNEYKVKHEKRYTLSEWFNPDILKRNAEKSNDELLQNMDNIFAKNAKTILPDIDCYSVISGGLDSSLASKYLQDNSNLNPQLICLQFPKKDHVASEIHKFSEFFKNPIKIKTVTEDLFGDFIKEAYKSTCLPLPTHSFISQAILAKEVNNYGSKVLFTGDGGDELFGGYEFYKTLNEYHIPPETNPSIYSGIVDIGVKFNNWNANDINEESRNIWNATFKLYKDFNSNEATIQSILMLDSTIQLESVGIRGSDSMSMMSSVESRGFFLSEDIVSFALHTPAIYKINNKSPNKEEVTRPLIKNLFKKNFNSDLL
ncbi:MAG: asparagine synthase-related protein, partial [Chloroflexota bacterium]|nr:asparagine synthase-related protein [Chloroflexota bacterium]